MIKLQRNLSFFTFLELFLTLGTTCIICNRSNSQMCFEPPIVKWGLSKWHISKDDNGKEVECNRNTERERIKTNGKKLLIKQPNVVVKHNNLHETFLGLQETKTFLTSVVDHESQDNGNSNKIKGLRGVGGLTRTPLSSHTSFIFWYPHTHTHTWVNSKNLQYADVETKNTYVLIFVRSPQEIDLNTCDVIIWSNAAFLWALITK